MKVKFLPSGEEYEIKNNETVLHLAHNHGIHIQSVCKGIPSCAECRVKIVEGEHNVIQPSSTEKALIGTAYFVDSRRLSCQLRCFGDITVDLTEQIEKEEHAAKKPRGRVIRDDDMERLEEESRAVMGSLVLDEEFDLSEFEDEEVLDLPEEERKKKKEKEKSGFYDQLEKLGKEKQSKDRNRNRNRNRRNKNKNKQGEGGQSASSSNEKSGTHRKKRRRRRPKPKQKSENG